MNNIPTSTVLDLAADAVQMAGWTQGGGWGLSFETEGLCLEGGIMAVIGTKDHTKTLWSCPAYQAVGEYLGRDTSLVETWHDRPEPRQPLWSWNDADERTAEEVIEVLRAAAAVERLKESTPAAYETEDQPLPLEVAA